MLSITIKVMQNVRARDSPSKLHALHMHSLCEATNSKFALNPHLITSPEVRECCEIAESNYNAALNNSANILTVTFREKRANVLDVYSFTELTVHMAELRCRCD